MAGRKQKRDNDYYLKRLEKEDPGIFADFKAGKYPSARQALKAAKLRQPQRPLNLLKNAWRKASSKDQADFLLWCGSSTLASASTPLIDADLRLLPGAAARIRQVMDRRGLLMGVVMRELGLKSRNPSLALALERNYRIRSDLAARLKRWLHDNRNV